MLHMNKNVWYKTVEDESTGTMRDAQMKVLGKDTGNDVKKRVAK